MKRITGYGLDAFLILCLLVFFYFHAFEKSQNIPPWSSGWGNIRLLLAILAMVTLPFRLKRYLYVSNLVVFGSAGSRRKTIIVPLLWMLVVIFGSLIILRTLVKLFGFGGVLQ
ncbi:hypothetical protein LMG22931_05544 [Paraburkholderia nemoris]|nr:hypothetical protein LMG22931_05544 [Paraburkholderia nemoris]